jgi:hypothetical protein
MLVGHVSVGGVCCYLCLMRVWPRCCGDDGDDGIVLMSVMMCCGAMDCVCNETMLMTIRRHDRG